MVLKCRCRWRGVWPSSDLPGFATVSPGQASSRRSVLNLHPTACLDGWQGLCEVRRENLNRPASRFPHLTWPLRPRGRRGIVLAGHRPCGCLDRRIKSGDDDEQRDAMKLNRPAPEFPRQAKRIVVQGCYRMKMLAGRCLDESWVCCNRNATQQSQSAPCPVELRTRQLECHNRRSTCESERVTFGGSRTRLAMSAR